MNKGQRLGIMMMMIVVCSTLRAQAPDDSHYQLSEFPFVFVSEQSINTPPDITDSLFDADSRGIRFKVNSSELQPSEPFISLYREKLVPWLKAHDMELKQVFVKGAASPEGSYKNNLRLSRERTQRLIEFLSKELGQAVNNKPIDAKSITEDYGLLVKMMQRAGDPRYEQVNEIWQSCQGDEACCKRRLMALDRGRVWLRLKKDYFPDLRQARVILWFALKPERGTKILPPVYNFAQTAQPLYDIPYILPEPSVETPVDYVRRHLIAARTNLLHDFLYVPQFGFAPGFNIQFEYYPLDGHYTYNAGFTFTNHRRWSKNKFFQIRDLQLELRRYFKGDGTFIGPYLGIFAEGTVYGIGFSKTKGWEGEGGGGGLSVGYTLPLNRKGNLRLELSASLGVFYTRYDPYVYGNPIIGSEDGLYYYDYLGNSDAFKKRNHTMTWVGPTNAGIHITYDIIYRKKQAVSTYQQKGGRR